MWMVNTRTHTHPFKSRTGWLFSQPFLKRKWKRNRQQHRGSEAVKLKCRSMASLRSNGPFGGALNKFRSKILSPRLYWPTILFLFSCSNYLRIGFMLMCKAFVPRGGFICLQKGKRKKNFWQLNGIDDPEASCCENGGAIHAVGSFTVGICSTMGKKHRRWICRILPPRLFSQCLSEIWISLKITWGPLNANFSECAKPLL